MKSKFSFWLALGVMCLFAGSLFGETRITFQTWADYSGLINTNVPVIDLGGQIFAKRAMLTLWSDMGKDGIGSKIKARASADFAKLSAPIRYLYADYDIAGWNAAVVSFGVIRSVFGLNAAWKYPIPINDVSMEYSAVMGSPMSDFGASLCGSFFPIENLTRNLISYNIAVVNGEGADVLFTASLTNGDDFGYQGTLSITPYNGISIGGSYRMQKIYPTAGGVTNASSYLLYLSVLNPEFSFGLLPLELSVQYLARNAEYKKNSGVTNIPGTVFSVLAGISFLENLITPYVRWDHVDECPATNTQTKFYHYNWIYAGINFSPAKDFYFKTFGGYNPVSRAWKYLVEMDYTISCTIW